MLESEVKEAASLLKLRDFLFRVDKTKSTFLDGRIKLVSHSTGTPEFMLSPEQSARVVEFLSVYAVEGLETLGVSPDPAPEKELKEKGA